MKKSRWGWGEQEAENDGEQLKLGEKKILKQSALKPDVIISSKGEVTQINPGEWNNWEYTSNMTNTNVLNLLGEEMWGKNLIKNQYITNCSGILLMDTTHTTKACF